MAAPSIKQDRAIVVFFRIRNRVIFNWNVDQFYDFDITIQLQEFAWFFWMSVKSMVAVSKQLVNKGNGENWLKVRALIRGRETDTAEVEIVKLEMAFDNSFF